MGDYKNFSDPSRTLQQKAYTRVAWQMMESSALSTGHVRALIFKVDSYLNGVNKRSSKAMADVICRYVIKGVKNAKINAHSRKLTSISVIFRYSSN